MKSHRIKFRVLVVARNTNAFGLRGHILVSRTGLAVEVGLNHLNVLPVGAPVEVPIPRRQSLRNPFPAQPEQKAVRRQAVLEHAVARITCGELPRLLAKAPTAVVAQAWTSTPTPGS